MCILVLGIYRRSQSLRRLFEQFLHLLMFILQVFNLKAVSPCYRIVHITKRKDMQKHYNGNYREIIKRQSVQENLHHAGNYRNNGKYDQ